MTHHARPSRSVSSRTGWILAVSVFAFVCGPACERRAAPTEERSAAAADDPSGESPPAPVNEATGSRAATAVSGDEATGDSVLMDHELCEVSAAAAARDGQGWWMADNERHDRLFVVANPGPTGLRTPERRPLDAADDGPRDVEALALGDAHFAVVGSHSRNKKCERKRKRARIRLYEAPTGTRAPLVEVALVETDLEQALRSPDLCVDTLLVQGLPAGDALCERLASADRSATKAACNTINVEGAVWLDDALWLGLRAPLLETRALLLAADRDALLAGELRVRDWRTLDLEGFGVRALTHGPDAGVLVGIAGPELDADDSHRLFTVSADALRNGAPGEHVEVSFGATLPTSSEALVRAEGAWIALVDGGEGDDEEGPCDSPSRQVRIPD